MITISKDLMVHLSSQPPLSAVGQQLDLLPLIPTGVVQARRGKDIEFYVFDENRRPVWCKPDSPHRRARATEWICTQLAERAELRTAGYRIVEFEGSTYFGSPNVTSVAQEFELIGFLRSKDRNLYGGTTLNRGHYLAGVIAFDFFINNNDRHIRNFILSDDGSYRRLCAIDFADADLTSLTTDRFPIAGSSTFELGRSVRAIHGSFVEGALSMLDRIEGITPEVFRGIVASVPPDWLHLDLKDRLNDAWGSSGFLDRLVSLRAGLKSGSLA